MPKLILAAIAVTVLITQPALSDSSYDREGSLFMASNDDSRNEQYHQGPRKSLDEIQAQLEAQGYDVQRLKHDDHYIEAYATRDGRKWEIKVSPTDGQILKIEAED